MMAGVISGHCADHIASMAPNSAGRTCMEEQRNSQGNSGKFEVFVFVLPTK
jgi:hypothetical protein